MVDGPRLTPTADPPPSHWDASYYVPAGIDREKWEAVAEREARLGRRVQFHVHGCGDGCDVGCWESRG